MGQLIRKFAEVKGLPMPNKEWKCHKKDRGDVRAKILARIFKGDPKDFADFQEEHKDLNIGQLSKKYAELNNLTIEHPMKEYK